MKFEVSKERHEVGVRGVTEAFIKMNYHKKTIKKIISLIFFLLVCFAVMIWLDQGTRIFGIIGVSIITLAVPTIFVTTKISLNKSKNQKIELNIEKVEQEYEEKIILVAHLKNGSKEKSEYSYEELNKMVEKGEYIYLFLNNNIAIVVDKLVINVEEFKQFIKNKNSTVEEIVL